MKLHINLHKINKGASNFINKYWRISYTQQRTKVDLALHLFRTNGLGIVKTLQRRCIHIQSKVLRSFITEFLE